MPTIYLILQRVLARTVKTSIPIIVGVLLTVLFLGAMVIHSTEHGLNSNFRTWGDCFWWAIVTISTVGYGDKVPITAGGRVIASFIMVAGPVLLASFAASIGATFYDEWQKGIKGMIKITSKEHILICGWNATAADVIAELRQSEVFSKTLITVIDESIDANSINDPRTTLVHGIPSDTKALEQANASGASYAIVIAKDNLPAADQQTVLTVLTIKYINPQIHICAEVNDVSNEGHLKRAGCNSIVNTGSLTSGLLAISLQNPAVSSVINELASFRGNEIYRVNVPQEHQQHRFGDLLSDYKKSHNAILIGIEREGETLLNPSADLELKNNDYLLVLSQECPY